MKLFATAALLAALPVAASAVTAPVLENIEETGATVLTSGGLYSFQYTEEETTGGIRGFMYEFIAADTLGAITGVSVNSIPMNGITGLFVQWLAEDGATVLAEWDGTYAPFTIGVAAGETRYLSIGWDSTLDGGDMNVNIQAVPVPAAALLLGTALAGLGLMRRKA